MKIFEGIVVSTSMNKTAVVEVSGKTPHQLYKKLIKRSKKYKVDTTGFEPAIGSLVKIVETRPISKNKYFKILSITGVKQLKKTIEPIDEMDSSIKVRKPATTETQKETETQKLSVSKNLSDSVVARKATKTVRVRKVTRKSREARSGSAREETKQ